MFISKGNPCTWEHSLPDTRWWRRYYSVVKVFVEHIWTHHSHRTLPDVCALCVHHHRLGVPLHDNHVLADDCICIYRQDSAPVTRTTSSDLWFHLENRILTATQPPHNDLKLRDQLKHQIQTGTRYLRQLNNTLRVNDSLEIGNLKGER
ncbi:hypothetical protein TNCV_528871 [Trichonephila clavipes]|nr:hypothetical protein TNCV_528871 [Trichonephila clavipes]